MADSNFKDSSFLIIDSIKQSRDTLKTFASNLGCSRVDLAYRMADIVNHCENISYDVLLLGYDLGEGKENGQQVLEELRERSLLGRHCIVIMITGEITQAMVLAALEHKPNEYLAKPYTLNDLLSRLNRSYKKVRAMRAIYKALDQNEFQQVIELCDKQIDKGSAYKTECLGIKSRQYLALGHIEDARQIYQESTKYPNCQWANMGLGKIAIDENKLVKASNIFEGIITQYPRYMAAYDYLAQTYELQNNSHKAETTLEKAVSLSPRSFSRVKKYAQLCYDNENFAHATDAFFKTNNLAKNSIHKSPDNAFGLTKSFLEYSTHLPNHKIRRIKTEVFKILAESGREFSSHEVKIHTGLLAARLHFAVEEMTDGTNTLIRTERLLERKIEDVSNKGLAEIADSLFKLNRADKAKDILYLLEQSKLEDEDLSNNIDSRHAIYSLSDLEKAQKILEVAINLYRSCNYPQAIEELNKALALYPHHIGLKLNLIQVLLVSYETDKNNNAGLKQAGILINDLDSTLESSKSYQRFTKLKHRYNILKK